jgi:hypothetical protein
MIRTAFDIAGRESGCRKHAGGDQLATTLVRKKNYKG